MSTWSKYPSKGVFDEYIDKENKLRKQAKIVSVSE